MPKQERRVDPNESSGKKYTKQAFVDFYGKKRGHKFWNQAAAPPRAAAGAAEEDGPTPDQQILVLGLNPALQKTMHFTDLRVNAVNRAVRVEVGTGGKGQNAARALHRLRPGCCRVAHPLGGGSGAAVEAMLGAAGVPQLTARVAGETRTCTTLCSAGDGSGETTELIDPSAAVAAGEAARLLRAVGRAIDAPATAAVLLCGSVPPGLEGAYEHAARRCRPGQLLFVDAAKGVGPALRAAAEGGVDVAVKINAGELRALRLAADGAGDAGSDGGLPGCAAWLHREYGVRVVGVTDGRRRGLLSERAGEALRQWHVDPPALPADAPFCNAIGAGDTCSAATALALALRRAAPVDAFVDGVAHATASCATAQPSHFDPGLASRLRDEVRVVPVGEDPH